MANTVNGQAMIRGSFTPEAGQNTYTVQLPISCQNFMVWKHTYSAPNEGYRAYLGAQKLNGEGMIGFVVTSNASGASWTAFAELNDSDIQIDGENVVITTRNAFFVSEQYDYIAW